MAGPRHGGLRGRLRRSVLDGHIARSAPGQPAEPDVLAFIDGERREHYVVFGLPDTRGRALPANVERVSHAAPRRQSRLITAGDWHRARGGVSGIAGEAALLGRPSTVRSLASPGPVLVGETAHLAVPVGVLWRHTQKATVPGRLPYMKFSINAGGAQGPVHAAVVREQHVACAGHEDRWGEPA
jgi:hypothetical protein